VGRPVVGITTYLTRAAFGAWDLDAALVPAAYVRSIVRAGGVPLLVPPGAAAEEALDALDGLVFSGGSDLDPELYGEAAHAATVGVVRERDDFELLLMRAALARDLPLLAVCRGSQVLNVALGGDLEQHVPDRVSADTHKQTPGVFAEHGVEVFDGTKLASIVGGHTDVKSHHHQGFAQARGRPARVSARRGRNGRSARGPDPALHPRRPLAPRGKAKTWRSSKRSSPKPPPTAPHATPSPSGHGPWSDQV